MTNSTGITDLSPSQQTHGRVSFALQFIGLALLIALVQICVFTIHTKNTSDWTIAESLRHVTENFGFIFLNQLDVLLVVVGILVFALLKLKSEMKWTLIVLTLAIHAFVGWFMICVRGEGGLGGILFP